MTLRHLFVALPLCIAAGLSAAGQPQPAPHGALALDANDAVTQSFLRLFAHEPTAARSPKPAGGGEDPLIAAMVEPLRHASRQSLHQATNHAANQAANQAAAGAYVPR